MRKRISGFTIVELLIVIVVIAILAAVTVVAYDGIQQRARATATATSIKQIDKSFRLYAIDQGWSTWPKDSQLFAVGTNPTIQKLVNDLPGFSDYLSQAPSVSGLVATDWFYDNNGDVKPACGEKTKGANIVVRLESQTLAGLVEDQLGDDGDLDCGTIRYTDNNDKLYYSLSYDSSM